MRSEKIKNRINRILNCDKEEMNEETRAAAVADFSRIAGEYFETDGEILFSVQKEKNELSVCVRFNAVRVKNFTVLK